jgi:signal transduction histidine kinase/ActR/RegA family two-component response regulator
MGRRYTLGQLLALVIAVMTSGAVGLTAFFIGEAAVRGLELEIGKSLTQRADQMQDKLNRTIFERRKEIVSAASLLESLGVLRDPDRVRIWLEELQVTYPDYAWIGLISPEGRVVRSTGGVLEGADVSRQDWFLSGKASPAVGDLRMATLPGGLRPDTGGTPARLIDISAPVVGPQRELLGVLSAQLNWSWAEEVRDSMFSSWKPDRSRQVLVVAKNGRVILGPPKLASETLDPAFMERITGPERSLDLEEWPDGRTYVSGFAQRDGYKDFEGLGWLVIVRQDASVALAPARHLQLQILITGGILALVSAVVGWLLARRISKPLLQLAQAAEKIRSDSTLGIPDIRAYAEATTLSQSFSALLKDLKDREASLAELNRSLELQVKERTNELAARNLALNVARLAAEKATAAKSRFLAAASHDLRQPLHAMMLVARALSRRVSDGEVVGLVGQLQTSLAALKKMFDALLNVSRLDAGLVHPNFDDVAVEDILRRVSNDFDIEAKERGLRFTCRSMNAMISTDPALFETMLRNLVANSLKFTRRGGIFVGAHRRAGGIAFEILDTGSGIPLDRWERIFDEFNRSAQDAEGINEGLGLGLSIVQRYADLLGIKVEMASRVGHGTRFTLIVPSAANDARAATGRSSLSGWIGSRSVSGLRVLILDDDSQIVEAMKRDLADRGCAPQGFTSATAAEAALKTGLIADVALVDFDLGNSGNGLAFLQRAEAIGQRPIPALILTGATDAVTLSKVTAAGRPYLNKPADPDAIAAVLSSLVKDAQAKSYPRRFGRVA